MPVKWFIKYLGTLQFHTILGFNSKENKKYDFYSFGTYFISILFFSLLRYSFPLL